MYDKSSVLHNTMRVQFNYGFFSRRSVALLSFFPHLFLLACIVVCLLCLLAFFFSFFSKFSVYVFFIVCLFLDLLCWQQVCPVEKKKKNEKKKKKRGRKKKKKRGRKKKKEQDEEEGKITA